MAVFFVVTNQAVDVNGEPFGYPANPNGTTMQIPCEGTQIIGSYWRIPQTQGGRVLSYSYITDNGSSNPPTADSIKVLEVKLTTTAGITTVFMAIANTDNIGTSSPVNQFAYLCDGLGGTLPVMPTIAIPLPILQNPPQTTDGSGDNYFYFPFPANPGGLLYTMNAVYFNGGVPSPAYAPSGITTVAQFVTWANANCSTYGTWTETTTSPVSNVVQLYSPVGAATFVMAAGMNVSLTPVNYCFDLTSFSTPAAVNGVRFGSGPILAVPAFQVTNNPIVLANALTPVMSSTTVFNTSGVAHKLGINTTMATPVLYYNGSVVSTAGSGTCS